MKDLFRTFAMRVAEAVGQPAAFAIAVLTIIAWAALGPLLHYSDSWQLVINTGTTIVTFLMVFLIQSVQNRDTRAVHLKLDELIRAVKGARNSMLNLEDLTDEELKKLHEEFKELHDKVHAHVKRRGLAPREDSSTRK